MDYSCSQCEWRYDWRMGDRVGAVKQHHLSHLWSHPVADGSLRLCPQPEACAALIAQEAVDAATRHIALVPA